MKNLIFEIVPATIDQNSVARKYDIRNKQILVWIFYAKFLADLMLQDYMKFMNAQLEKFFKGLVREWKYTYMGGLWAQFLKQCRI